MILCSVAPTAPPMSVTTPSSSSSTSVTVQWGETHQECLVYHQNGVITGYSVQYVSIVEGSG